MKSVAHIPPGLPPPAVLVGPKVRPSSDGLDGARAASRRVAPLTASRKSIVVVERKQRAVQRLPAPLDDSSADKAPRPGSPSTAVVIVVPERDIPRHGAHNLFLAQRIAQEVLEEGLFLNRHPAASAAYEATASSRMTFHGPEGSLDIAV
ncbi:MAG: hypothetical protein V3U18_05730 [Alphaproteobacteria bacterium]